MISGDGGDIISCDTTDCKNSFTLDALRRWMGAEAVENLEENEDIPFKCFSCDGGLGYFKTFLSKTDDWVKQLEDFRLRLEKFKEKEKEKEESGFKICGFRDAVLTPVLEKVVFEKEKVIDEGIDEKMVENSVETVENSVETVENTVEKEETENEEPPAKKPNSDQSPTIETVTTIESTAETVENPIETVKNTVETVETEKEPTAKKQNLENLSNCS